MMKNTQFSRIFKTLIGNIKITVHDSGFEIYDIKQGKWIIDASMITIDSSIRLNNNNDRIKLCKLRKGSQDGNCTIFELCKVKNRIRSLKEGEL